MLRPVTNNIWISLTCFLMAGCGEPDFMTSLRSDPSQECLALEILDAPWAEPAIETVPAEIAEALLSATPRTPSDHYLRFRTVWGNAYALVTENGGDSLTKLSKKFGKVDSTKKLDEAMVFVRRFLAAAEDFCTALEQKHPSAVIDASLAFSMIRDSGYEEYLVAENLEAQYVRYEQFFRDRLSGAPEEIPPNFEKAF